MRSDKILIFVALIMVLTIFAFRGRIVQEFQLFRKLDSSELDQNLGAIYFYPLSQQERINVTKDHLEKMNEIQEEVSKSIVVKHFVDVDFREHIALLQEDIHEKEKCLETEEDIIIFSTHTLSHVIASMQFSKEQLLQLACLIDETFPEDTGRALYMLDLEDNHLVLDMCPYEDYDPIEKSRYQEFVNQVSRDIFEENSVLPRVDFSDSDTDVVFESMNYENSL